ncbi:MAG: bacteriocin-protection protein [Sphingobacteriales bacterium]|nr:MAG: bacteriocin-protection protein [Sphingobacteriales bacterium]
MSPRPQFFSSAVRFRKWLQQHHATAKELIVGFYKTGSGKKSMTWSQSVDEALCFGWIDGVRTSIDENSYQIRFTPRRPNSIWSAVNIKKIEILKDKGLMQPAGIAIFEKRSISRVKLYAHEQDTVKLSPAFEKIFKASKTAWKYFQTIAPSYQKASVNWVMSANQEATQLKRLQFVIDESALGINQFRDHKYKK